MDKEIKALVDDINKSVHELKSEQGSIKGKVDAFDQAKIDRIADELTKKQEKLQELEQKQAKIEAMINRQDFGKEDKSADMLAEHKSAFDKFMRDTKGKSEIEIFAKAMSTDVNPDGGYLVRPELANFVVDRVFETSPLRMVARVETISSKSLEVLIDDNEAGARWVSEGASGGETTTPQFGLKEIVAHKIEADPKITMEQIQDSYLDVEAWLQGKISDKFARTENTAFVTGNGVGKPRGFLTYDDYTSADVYERDKIEQFNLGSASALTSDGLIDMQGLLKEKYQANAVWAMKRATYTAALKLKGSDNYYFGQEFLKNGISVPTLLGKRVIFMDDMPAIAGNALSVAYADFSKAYTIVDRVGLQVLKDPFTNKGFMTYYTTKRTGGDVTCFDAIKIGKIST